VTLFPLIFFPSQSRYDVNNITSHTHHSKHFRSRRTKLYWGINIVWLVTSEITELERMATKA